MGAEMVRQHLKTGFFAPLYLLYGPETYLSDLYARKISEKTAAEFPDFNLQRFDRESFTLQKFRNAVESLPVMSDRKCVLLHDVDPDALRADDWKEIVPILGDIPSGCTVVLHFSAVEYSKKSSRWKALIAAAQKAGVAAEMDYLPKPEIVRWIVKRAAERGSSISADTAEKLADACGGEMSRVETELEKLSALRAADEIKPPDIEALVSKTLDSSIYDLARVVTSGSLTRSLELLGELFYQKEEPVVVLSALSGAFCDLYRAKIAQQSGVGAPQVAADFQYKGREFRVRNALRDSARLELSFLRGCLDCLMRADRDLKSSRMDSRIVLERLLVEISGLKRRR